MLGLLYVTRSAARYMLENGSGSIVFVSSTSGRRVPTPESTVYAATKHAANAIAEGLCMDLSEDGIRSIIVEPDLVRTEFPETSHPNAGEFYENKGYTPLRADDIANAVLHDLEQPDRESVNEILVRSTDQKR